MTKKSLLICLIKSLHTLVKDLAMRRCLISEFCLQRIYLIISILIGIYILKSFKHADI